MQLYLEFCYIDLFSSKTIQIHIDGQTFRAVFVVFLYIFFISYREQYNTRHFIALFYMYIRAKRNRIHQLNSLFSYLTKYLPSTVESLQFTISCFSNPIVVPIRCFCAEKNFSPSSTRNMEIRAVFISCIVLSWQII